MKDKIEKIISIIKKDGIKETIKKVCKYLNSKYKYKFNIFAILKNKSNMKKYNIVIEQALKGKYDRIILWQSDFRMESPFVSKTTTYC